MRITTLAAATFTALALAAGMTAIAPADDQIRNPRRPQDDSDLRYWLDNMVWYHGFTMDEMIAATGMGADQIKAAQARLRIYPNTRPDRPADAPLLVLPYPGGRHPRIGFLEGAIRPQRETKISVFAPWNEESYVVVDVPEAIWWNTPEGRELLYLAHTHIDTTWTRQGIEMERLEWQRFPDGTLSIQRRLPNQVVFGTRIRPGKDAVRMEMWLTNGTDQRLTGLSVQNCVMLAGAPEFAQQAADNKVSRDPYQACRSPDGSRWVITAWEPCNRTWANPPCPCMHSDPRFADCDPGRTVQLIGWLSFYQGADIQAELDRIEATGWRSARRPEQEQRNFTAGKVSHDPHIVDHALEVPRELPPVELAAHHLPSKFDAGGKRGYIVQILFHTMSARLFFSSLQRVAGKGS